MGDFQRLRHRKDRSSTRSSAVEPAETALVADRTDTSGHGPSTYMRGASVREIRRPGEKSSASPRLTREISPASEAAGPDGEDEWPERSSSLSVLAESTPDSNGTEYQTMLAEAAEFLSRAPPARSPSPAPSLPEQDDGNRTLPDSPGRMPNPAQRTVSIAVCFLVALAIWAGGFLAASSINLSLTPSTPPTPPAAPCSSQNDPSLDLVTLTSRALRDFPVGHPVPVVDLPFSITSRIHELELAVDSVRRDMLGSLLTCWRNHHTPCTSPEQNGASARRELASWTVSLHAQVDEIVAVMAQTILDITAVSESLSEVSSATERQKRDLLADLRPSSSWWRTFFARSGALATEFKRLSSRGEHNEEALQYLDSAQGMLNGLHRQWGGLAGVLRTVKGAMDRTGGDNEEDQGRVLLQVLCEVIRDAVHGADIDAAARVAERTSDTKKVRV
ncbi:MAG: hypothetical protein OHK93_005009 [Ramalina farinacea]|uniref:Uncharacterized protein n=1 Tax=Ramalina farinacea TaxID=258253 RepID=A0AA43QV73_9LECA|nr:hypothetical protein [Ramalina farinacea]